ncbi:RsmE family RNA methyltransferase [Desulfovibrio litoralis]|uniref:Ribosomal RNA small subunit methyltransferase E n=1 Tax=Desulfovibrio litoralis DSM 11393 TaxID=1121455 RepID=A0A1M7SX66_9BACT|nr:RsmE family RNA methyltransferase [Desulfovibrio litoralis]SHN63050.1 16S rRNA (uracil1498-N3)-methyltransferase [Desulfovibrio litoralis DSM 11393]
MHTFYLNPEQWNEFKDKDFILENDEAKHLIHVLRLGINQELRLIDGQGRCGLFKIVKLNKKQVVLNKLSESYSQAMPNRPILALAFTKTLKRSWIMEKAVEFHAAEIWLWQAERSQGKIPQDALSHWNNQLIAGAKQCQNLWLPKVKIIHNDTTHVCPGAAGLAHSFDLNIHQACLLWEEENNSNMLEQPDIFTPQKTTVFIIGPEGGLSLNEVKVLLEGGAEKRSLGKTILRYESAALLCLGLSWWAKSVYDNKSI